MQTRRLSMATAVSSGPLQSLSGDIYSDSRFHGHQGPSRNVRLSRVTTSAGGTLAKSEDGVRCVVAGRESLRILRLSDTEDTSITEQTSAVGHSGHCIDLSRNLWDGSGLKIESASTDVAWCSGNYNKKILTSGRNGDLIMWDLEKVGSTKYERKTRNHIRSIHKLSCSSMVPYYCITGSADGDIRIWDLRDMSRSVMKIHHPTCVRSLVFSPTHSNPLQAVAGLDNGSIYRWDLQMGQRGQLDRMPLAHTGPILALDWCSTWVANKGADNPTQLERSWIVSGGLDHTVKVWDLPGSSTALHIVNKPTYVLHPPYPVRRVLWRPEYPCEVALVSNAEFSGGGGAELLASPRMQSIPPSFLAATAPVSESNTENKATLAGETIEIWDIRRGWIAKWTVDTSVSDGGVTDAAFRDSHALLVQHASGTFAQVDLRHSHRPIDAVPRVALSWNAICGTEGALSFVADKRGKWEVPYDDVHPNRRSLLTDRKFTPKALGDRSRVPCLQNMGTYVRIPTSTNNGPEVFVKLAKGYVVAEKPKEKKDVCTLNAEVATLAGNVHAAQAWILLRSLLTDIVPDSLATSLPAPSALPSNDSVRSPVSNPASYRTLSADATVSSPLRSPAQSRLHRPKTPRSTSNENAGHHRDAQPPATKPPPNSRNLTPASSASSSPRHVPISLPPTPALPPTTMMTPTTVAQRRPSILVSTASLVYSHVRRPSVYSRVTSAHSESDKNLRYVGEGALDDSDSSDGAASESIADSHVSEVDHIELAPAPPKPNLKKTRSFSIGRLGPAHPSPLSQLAGQQQWSEEEGDGTGRTGTGTRTAARKGLSRLRVEDDEASPSPVSTDSDGERSDNSKGDIRRCVVTTKSRSLTRSRSRKSSCAYAGRLKGRSQSSTVASLAAPLLSPAGSSSIVPPIDSPKHTHGAIPRAGSQSSIETVIAASIREQENDVAPEEPPKHIMGDKEPNCAEMSHRRKVAVMEEERQLREVGWCALQEALEEYADEGDVQMCTMLALVAAKELKLGLGRTIQFMEAYVDMLVRYRLHTCAAYLRKYSQVEEVQKTTRLETVIYTACRKCRKPVMAVRSRNSLIKVTHAVCATCKEAVVRCSICHLPVRTLLFQCSVCSHGGHQDCYRRFYMERPMVDLPGQLITRGRQLQRDPDSENEGEGGQGVSASGGERGIVGHPCAAGCGHYCWVAISQSGDI